LIPEDTNIGFVRLRYWAFGITGLLTFLAVATAWIQGLNLGVDFVGGLMVEAQFPQAPPIERVRATVDRLGFGESHPAQFGDGRTVSIRVPAPASDDPQAAAAESTSIRNALAAEFPGVTITRNDSVSGKVSDELIRKGILAVLLAVFGIAIFSWLRYEWQFGVSTFVAVMHDVLMTLGFFAITRMEFDLTTVAAILTIIGYSINDKI